MKKDYQELLKKQREFFNSGKTFDLSFRKEQLKICEKMLRDYSGKWVEALREDLRKAPVESITSEIAFVLDTVKHTLEHLEDWAQDQSYPTPMMLKPASSRVLRVPKGLCLIIGPWNYPMQLLLSPLVASISAGNCNLLKPSELVPHSEALFEEMIPKYFDPSYVALATGGPELSQELLTHKFDHIFFTGSTAVGKLVYKAAAEQLTPVTLELGGKSPAIVSRHAKLELAARRLVWGKFLNAGQTCVAPDYVLVDAKVKERFLSLVKEEIQKQFGDDPKSAKDYARVVNQRHFDRLMALMEGQKPLLGGDSDREEKYLAPTIIDSPDENSALMKEEIFGPILPVLGFDDFEELLDKLSQKESPLAAYLFSNREKEKELFARRVLAGGIAINETVMHLANHNIPFGGVGASGIGAYHGEFGFREFSHEKSVFEKASYLDFKFRYPPYKDGTENMLSKLYSIKR